MKESGVRALRPRAAAVPSDLPTRARRGQVSGPGKHPVADVFVAVLTVTGR